MVKIYFCDYKNLSKAQTIDLLRLRNSDEVRLNSANTDIIRLDDHLGWVKELESEKYFAVIIDDVVVGGLNCPKDKWGVFFKADLNPVLKMLCVYLYLHRIFQNNDILGSAVCKNNTAALSLNYFFGFKLANGGGLDDNFYYLLLKKSEFLSLDNSTIRLLKRTLKNTNIVWC
ncbi:hypothetical protein [Campylobacter majalis]|uniref:hypothetical protein n=1 Tax=Campylobacter majalis TaxID=2790656 RepID=UPI003D683452